MSEERIDSIRKEMSVHKGDAVVISTKAGRRGMLCKTGTLINVYPDVFLVSVNEDGYCKKYCYAYADVLTHSIDISVVQ